MALLLHWVTMADDTPLPSIPAPNTRAAYPDLQPQPQVMVGPISPRPARPAIEDEQVAAFAAAAAAEEGLVLVSFGSSSAVFGSLLVRDDYKGLALAFADLAPVR